MVMKKSVKKADERASVEERIQAPYPVVGRVAEAKKTGEILVEFDGGEPVPARLLSSIDRRELSSPENVGREVLLMFDRGLRAFPIIVGQLENLIGDMVSLEIEPGAKEADQPKDVLMDQERIVLNARKEIVLRCGEGSITLHKDGKIVVLGTNLISRSKGSHKIKGASVSIN